MFSLGVWGFKGFRVLGVQSLDFRVYGLGVKGSFQASVPHKCFI